MAKVGVRLRVNGLVHGVFFRASLSAVASERGVSGWVRNVPDGSVEAVLEGEEESVMEVIEWARRGPPRARVDSLKTETQPVKNLRGFRIDG